MKRPGLGRILLLLALVAAAGAIALVVVKSRRGDPEIPEAASSEPEPVLVAGEPIEMIFDKKLGTGWDDWGFGRHDYKAGAPVQISFAGYGAILFHHASLAPDFGGLTFRYKAPAEFGSFLQAALKLQTLDEQKLPRVDVLDKHTRVLADGWKEVWIPWSELNPSGSTFDQVVIRARTLVGPELVSLDRVALTTAGSSVSYAARKSRVVVDCRKPTQRISPWIYGVADSAESLGAPIVRIGGNTMTRLNWDIGNVWNTGNDWFFRNVSGPKGLREWLADSAKVGVQVALVVPMIGWVAKDGTSVGFPASRFPDQQKYDPKHAEAGNGAKPSGKPISPGPPTLTSEPAPPERIERWIRKLREEDAARGSRSVHMYILDNEPMLWHKTHRDVHPEPVGYDELLQRTIAYGTAIRRADPDAVIAGPAEWGWTAYFFSAKDAEVGVTFQPDKLAHGGIPLLQWYLQKLAAHEKQTGTRILDVVDLHFYPQAEGVYDGKQDKKTAALRVRSTRALWDETYRDESWIGEHVQLIPRLKAWVSGNYPGRGLSIGEWNFGAERHISGALAIAETLGRFGQNGLRSAFYWRAPPANTPAFYAFRAFRNFDGKGAKFEDFSLATQAAPSLSSFASRNEAGTRLTAVVLNLDERAAAEVNLDLSGCGTVQSSRTFMYRDKPPALSESAPAKGQLEAQRFEPHSFGVIEVALKPPP